MTYMERIATEAPATLIAAEVTTVKHALDTWFPTAYITCGSWPKVRERKALHAEVLDALRAVWLLANRNDPTWRDALTAFIERYEERLGNGRNRLIRYRLIAEHAPADVVHP